MPALSTRLREDYRTLTQAQRLRVTSPDDTERSIEPGRFRAYGGGAGMLGGGGSLKFSGLAGGVGLTRVKSTRLDSTLA